MGDFRFTKADLLVPPGSRADGWLTFDGDLGDGLRVPVSVVNGSTPGPVLWVQGALHGDECYGTLALIRWLDEVDPSALAGTVVAVPVLNVLAFRDGLAASQLDAINLNRVFPGDDSGSWTQRFAAWLLHTVEAYSHALLDLHGGGAYLEVCRFAFFAAGDTGDTAGLAAASGAEYLCQVPQAHSGALYSVLASRGIPSVLFESGGGLSCDEAAISSHLTAIDGILKQLGMVSSGPGLGRMQRTPSPTIIDTTVDIRSRAGGIATRRVPVGLKVTEGETLLELRGMHGELRERITCPVARAVVLSAVSSALVQPGAYAFLLGVLKED